MKKSFLFFLVVLISHFVQAQNEFITVWDLSKPGSSPTSITFKVGQGLVSPICNYTWETIPLTSSGSGSFITGNASSPSNITISGLPSNSIIKLKLGLNDLCNFKNYGADAPRLIDIEHWGTGKWFHMYDAFSGCSNLNITAVDIPNLIQVEYMSSMFQNCTSLNGPSNIGLWNVSQCDDFSHMFAGATSFNQPIYWNIYSEAFVSYMFAGATSFNQPIYWSFNNSGNAVGMFQGATSFDQNMGNYHIRNALGDNTIYLNNMFDNSGMSCQNYYNTLLGWKNFYIASGPISFQNETNNATLGVLNINLDSTTLALRDYFTSIKNWTFLGDSLINNCCTYATNTITVSVCDSFIFNNQTLSNSGTYYDTLVNFYGCDSILKLILHVNNSNVVVNQTTCNSYFFNNQTLTSSGTYHDTLINTYGCDSLVTLNLNISSIPITNTINQTACNTYFFNNQTLTTSGIYYDTLLNSFGCDSIVELNLTINNPTSTQNQTVCDSYFFNNQILTSNGTYYDTLVNALGCDSLITLNLTIYNTSTNIINLTTCNSYLFNNQTLTTSGVYYDTLINANGCDSLITLNLAINNTSTNIINLTTCDSYFFNNQTLTNSGVYYDTLINANGCDSLITLNLTINNTSTNIINLTTCDSYFFNNQTLTNSGVYYDTLINANGCDSLITLNLTIINPTIATIQNGTTLSSSVLGANYQWLTCNPFAIISGANSQTFTATSNGYYAVSVTQNGCTDTSNCITVTSVGIDEVNNNNSKRITIYPNPSNGNLIISTASNFNNATIKIISLTGQKILQKNNCKGKQVDIDISHFSNGIYFAEITDEHKTSRMKVSKE